MTNLKALGYAMDYCNKNYTRVGITQEQFEEICREILASPEGRFESCADSYMILRELGRDSLL